MLRITQHIVPINRFEILRWSWSHISMAHYVLAHMLDAMISVHQGIIWHLRGSLGVVYLWIIGSAEMIHAMECVEHLYSIFENSC